MVDGSSPSMTRLEEPLLLFHFIPYLEGYGLAFQHDALQSVTRTLMLAQTDPEA